MGRGATIGGMKRSRQNPRVCAPEKLDSEHPLFILYTSGRRENPKASCIRPAGYLLGARSRASGFSI